MLSPDALLLVRKGVLISMLARLAILTAGAQSLPPAQSARDSLNGFVGPSGAANPNAVPPNPGAPPAADSAPTSPTSAWFFDGTRRLPFQVGMTVGGYFDDNIYAAPDGPARISDFIWSVSPLIAWNSAAETGADNSVQLAYAPTFVLYQENSRNDTIDQAGNFLYAYHDGRMDFVVSESAASAQESNADVDDLVQETSSVTLINFNYQLTAKTTLNLSATQSITDDDPGFGSIQWSGAAYLDYQITPKTTLGLGGVVGLADLDGPNQTFEQANGRVTYNPTAKLSFNATGGLEFRETQGFGGEDLTPDFSLGLSYEPFDGTTLTVQGYRRYEYSGRLYGQDYLATGATASFSQRFFRKFYFVVSGVFENAEYEDNLSDSSSNVRYNYYSVQPAISFQPTTWCDLTLFYQHREDISQATAPGFTDNQVGFTAKFTY
jgi:hypothetical protein